MGGFNWYQISAMFAPFVILWLFANYMHRKGEVYRFVKGVIKAPERTTLLGIDVPPEVLERLADEELQYEDEVMHLLTQGNRAVIEKIFNAELALKACRHPYFNPVIFDSCEAWLSEDTFNLVHPVEAKNEQEGGATSWTARTDLPARIY